MLLRSLMRGMPFVRRQSFTSATALILFGLIIVAIAVRTRQYFYCHSYWYDEAYRLLILPHRAFADFFGPLPYNEVAPPGFLLMLRCFAEAGIQHERVMRLPSLVFSLLSLACIIPLATRVTGKQGFLWAVACAALSPEVFVHGSEVHPYILDILIAILILGIADKLATRESQPCNRRRTWATLSALGCSAPWLSFPSAFYLGGASLAIAWHLRESGERREWRPWMVFNGIVALSGAAMWYFFARHMYYAGMHEHWGMNGWGGFPDWNRIPESLWWLITRPFEITQYANFNVGWSLLPLVAWGCIVSGRNRPALLILLLSPFLIALGASLVGKYPLADRTLFFLAPSVWLLSGIAITDLWSRGRKGQYLVGIACANLAINLVSMLTILVAPHKGMDYRGAYEFVHERWEATDVIYDQMGVVYDLYYGRKENVYFKDRFDQLLLQAPKRRIWAVGSDTDVDALRAIEAAGGKLISIERKKKVDVRVYEPRSWSGE